MKNPTISGLIGGKLVWLISAAYLHNCVSKTPVVVVDGKVTDDDDLDQQTDVPAAIAREMTTPITTRVVKRKMTKMMLWNATTATSKVSPFLCFC
jgi:ribosomal protein L18E